MSQVESAYLSLTQGCTSIQQSNIVAQIHSMFESTITQCQEVVPYFRFSLTIHKDIYYDAYVCSTTFEQRIEEAFETFDNQVRLLGTLRACKKTNI